MKMRFEGWEEVLNAHSSAGRRVWKHTRTRVYVRRVLRNAWDGTSGWLWMIHSEYARDFMERGNTLKECMVAYVTYRLEGDK